MLGECLTLFADRVPILFILEKTTKEFGVLLIFLSVFFSLFCLFIQMPSKTILSALTSVGSPYSKLTISFQVFIHVFLIEINALSITPWFISIRRRGFSFLVKLIIALHVSSKLGSAFSADSINALGHTIIVLSTAGKSFL